MRVLWTIVRGLLGLACLATLLVTPLFVSTSAGTSIDSTGAVIDAVAVVILVVVAASLWRDRRVLA